MTSDDRPPDAEASEDDATEFSIDLPSDVRHIEAAVSYLVGRCRSFSFDGPRLELNFRVGVTEALANAVLYGNRSDPNKTVRIEVLLDRQHVEVLVADEGSGFDPESVPDPTRPENITEPGGRGLFLIRHLMDEMEFNERGNAVRVVLGRGDPPGATGKGR
jgi:serine/threonine-protein kinase RsbW